MKTSQAIVGLLAGASFAAASAAQAFARDFGYALSRRAVEDLKPVSHGHHRRHHRKRGTKCKPKSNGSGSTGSSGSATSSSASAPAASGSSSAGNGSSGNSTSSSGNPVNYMSGALMVNNVAFGDSLLHSIEV